MEAVLRYLRENQSRFVQELCDYVRIPSVSAQPAHKAYMERAAGWIKGQFEASGLSAELHPTKGHPIVTAQTPRTGGKKSHFLVYGHYDVQPPEPLELWKSGPFEPRIEGKFVYGRGASDNKGQHLAHLKAVEAYLKTGTELP